MCHNKDTLKAIAMALHDNGVYKTAALPGLTQDIQSFRELKLEMAALQRRTSKLQGVEEGDGGLTQDIQSFRELKREIAALRRTSKASGS